jgi:hypothetical protein
MSVIGARPYQGLFTEAEAARGKIPPPGTRASVIVNGDPKEFVVVKMAAATLVNGSILALAADITGLSVLSTAPVKTLPAGGRMGVLVIASATATITAAATVLAWAQIYGQCLARCSATGVDTVGMILCPSAVPGSLHLQVAGTASHVAQGITAIATSAGAVLLLNVMLNYPMFIKGDELA